MGKKRNKPESTNIPAPVGGTRTPSDIKAAAKKIFDRETTSLDDIFAKMEPKQFTDFAGPTELSVPSSSQLSVPAKGISTPRHEPLEIVVEPAKTSSQEAKPEPETPKSEDFWALVSWLVREHFADMFNPVFLTYAVGVLLMGGILLQKNADGLRNQSDYFSVLSTSCVIFAVCSFVSLAIFILKKQWHAKTKIVGAAICGALGLILAFSAVQAIGTLPSETVVKQDELKSSVAPTPLPKEPGAVQPPASSPQPQPSPKSQPPPQPATKADESGATDTASSKQP